MKKSSAIRVLYTIKLPVEKKKKKKSKKNKINIGTSIIYSLRCTIKVLRYFIYENKISKFNI